MWSALSDFSVGYVYIGWHAQLFHVLRKIVDIFLVFQKKEKILSEPPHDKTNKMACAPSKDSDQPGHPPSPISLRCPYGESLIP